MALTHVQASDGTAAHVQASDGTATHSQVTEMTSVASTQFPLVVQVGEGV